MSRLIPIHPDNLTLALKDVSKYLVKALDYAIDYKLDDVKKFLFSNQMTLWVVYNDDKAKATGCLVTEVTQHPQTQCLTIFCLVAKTSRKS